MRTIILMLAIAMLVTPALARQKCSPYIKKYWRSASGGNTALIGFKCSGSGNGHSMTTNEICGITDNGKKVCGQGWKRLSINNGDRLRINFKSSQYPIQRIFLDQ